MKNENLIHAGISRRDFVHRSVKGVIGAAILPTVLGSCSNWKGANDRVVVGHIGVGSRGTDELMSYFLPLREAMNIAVCDTFKSRRENVASKINQFYNENNFTEKNAQPILIWMSCLRVRISMSSTLPHVITGMCLPRLKLQGPANILCSPNRLV